jgi:DNA-binding transcriptional LysR family regulator
VIPQLTRVFLKQHPGVRLELKCERSQDLLKDLKARRLDLVLVSFRSEDPELEAAFLLEDELVLITAPTHPLGRRGRAEFRDLATEPLLMMDISQPSPWHQRVADAFLRNKIPLRLRVENAPIEAIKKMVAMGLGVGFVPLLCVKEEVMRGELSTIEVEGFREVRSVWLVRRWAQHSHAVEAFIKVALEFGTELIANPNALELRTKTNKVVVVNHCA